MAKSDNKVLMIYYDSEVLINALSDEEAGKVLKSLLRVYAKGEEPLEMSGESKMVFLALSNTINRQISDYRERNERRSRAKKAYWDNKHSDNSKS